MIEHSIKWIYRMVCHFCGSMGPMALTESAAEQLAKEAGFDVCGNRCAGCVKDKKPRRGKGGKFLKMVKTA